MQNFFIDGSNKGLTIGFGIAQVDVFGFMKLHEGHSFHATADSDIAELYAFEQTINILSEQKISRARIFVDQYRVEQFFRHSVSDFQVSFTGTLNPADTNYAYINSIRSKIIMYYTSVGFNINPIEIVKQLDDNLDPSEVIYVNTAHKLSRSYLKHVDDIFMSDDTPLKTNSTFAKIQINAQTKKDVVCIDFAPSSNGFITIDVIREAGVYTSFYKGEKILSSKHAVNIVDYTLEEIKKVDIAEDFQVKFFSAQFSLFREIKSSVGYENCPTDIFDRGNNILEKVKSKELALTTKQ